jgi:hypothetical protein
LSNTRSNALKSKEQSVQANGEGTFDQEMVAAVAQHFALLLIGPLLIALAVLLFDSPAEYASIAILRIDRPTASSLQALVPEVANDILAKYPGAGDGPESRARFLSQHLRLTDPEPASDDPGDRLFRLEVTYTDSKSAQAIASDVIEAWLHSHQGASREIIVQAPHRPPDPVEPRAGALALLYGVAAVPVFFALIVLGRYLAPGLSVPQLLSRNFRRAS